MYKILGIIFISTLFCGTYNEDDSYSSYYECTYDVYQAAEIIDTVVRKFRTLNHTKCPYSHGSGYLYYRLIKERACLGTVCVVKDKKD